jgi:hypothetical protein
MSVFKGLAVAITLVLAGLMGGCAAQPALLAGASPPFITKVTVVKNAPLGSVNMAEDLRVKILQRSPAYAAAGISKTLEVQIIEVGFKNPVAALIAGDSNRVKVAVRVTDGVTGKVDTTYDAFAIDSAVINGIAGAVMSAIDDPIDIEQRLTEAAARALLSKLYGTETAQRARDKAIDGRVVAQYPRVYAELKIETRCNTILAANEASAADPNDKFRQMQGQAGPLPAECASVGVVAKPAKKRA